MSLYRVLKLHLDLKVTFSSQYGKSLSVVYVNLFLKDTMKAYFAIVAHCYILQLWVGYFILIGVLWFK